MLKRILTFSLFAMLVSLQSQAQDKTIQLIDPVTGADNPVRIACELRRSYRSFTEGEIRQDHLATLVWMACGENRPDEHKRTVPSARNAQEIELYVFTKDGVYKYIPGKHLLNLVTPGDHRAKISQQEFFAQAPIALVLVANYDKMKDFDAASRDFYAAVDCGYVSQNIYMFCAASDLYGTVACGAINRDAISTLLKIKNGKVMLAHPVGHVQH